jgi:hypothetical protein
MAIQQDYIQYCEGTKMGMKTAGGDIIIPAIYDYVIPISDGLFNVKEGDHTAYFDKEGNEVLPFSNKYETWGNFTEGLARVRIHGKWGFINKKGQEVIHPQFHYTEEFSNGRAIVRNEAGMHGAIDMYGNLVIDYRFTVLANFVRGYARFGDLNTWGLIDKAGNIVVPQQYISIGTVYNKQVTVQVLEGEEYKEGLLTIGGDVEWNHNLDYINEFNVKKEQFTAACEQLVEELYKTGCPCEYERFRDFIQWNNPVGFVDQEVLYTAFSKKLEDLGNDVFRCHNCGTCYKPKLTQYTAFLWVLNVNISTIGNISNKGAKIPPEIPVALGFYGYDTEKYTGKYVQRKTETVINYLKEE